MYICIYIYIYAVTNYTSEPARKHFTEALAAVIADDQCKPPQPDLLGIIPAWESYDKVRPLIVSKKAIMSTNEIALKDAVDKRFIMYMQVCLFSALYPWKCYETKFSTTKNAHRWFCSL